MGGKTHRPSAGRPVGRVKFFHLENNFTRPAPVSRRAAANRQQVLSPGRLLLSKIVKCFSENYFQCFVLEHRDNRISIEMSENHGFVADEVQG